MESTSEVVSNTADEKSACFEVQSEAFKHEHVSCKTPEAHDKHVADEKTVEQSKSKQVEVSDPVFAKQEEIKKLVVEAGELEQEENSINEETNKETNNQNTTSTTTTTEEIIDTADGGQTKTITTVQNIQPDSAKIVSTTSNVTSEKDSPAIKTIEHKSEKIKVQVQDMNEKNNEHEAINDDDAEESETESEEEDEEEAIEEERNNGQAPEKPKEHKEQECNNKIVVDAGKQSEDDSTANQHQVNEVKISQLPETQTQKQIPVTEETVVDAPSTETQINECVNHTLNKQENLNNTLKDIISSIDSNIKAEENIVALKERELKLLQKQQELAREIEQQQLLAQKLSHDNHLKQQFKGNFISQDNNSNSIPMKTYQPTTNVSKYTTFEEKHDNNIYSRKSEMFETRESTNVSKKIDLHKIFTPATDAEEILPKNRKLYASSAFYSPTLHPTVEDQVELARRISNSLSDISNQQSRGQSMYVNRKKRSVKWVHEGCGQDYHQQQPKPSTSPSILPAYTDAAKHRVQLNLHQEQLLEKYAKPGLKVVQTPWQAALYSGSASAAFVEEQKLFPYPGSTLTSSPTPQIFAASQNVPATFSDSYKQHYSPDNYQRYSAQQQAQHERQYYAGTNTQRELAYKPSIPQGWKAPSMSLPKDLYMPKEIPLQSYAPPPAAGLPSAITNFSTNAAFEVQRDYQPINTSPITTYSLPELAPTIAKSYDGSNTFPISKPYQQGFSATYGNIQPPKQQYLPPDSYKKVPQNASQNVPQVSFNPSPLSYDKLAKFENPPANDGRYISSPSSPSPFAGSYTRPYTPSCDGHYYGGSPSVSPCVPAAGQQYNSGHNTPNYAHPNVTSNQLLNAPTYNTSARGWGCSGAVSTGYQCQPSHITNKLHIINTASMPYTDF